MANRTKKELEAENLELRRVIESIYDASADYVEADDDDDDDEEDEDEDEEDEED